MELKPKYPRTILLYVATFALTAVAVPQIAGAVTSFAASKRAAIAVKDELASLALSSASAQALSIAILVDGLTAGAQLAQRCAEGKLPAAVVHVEDVCQSAAVEEITDEQDAYVELRGQQQDARSLVTRLANQLESDQASRQWAATAQALRILQQLESSTNCNADRAALLDQLRNDQDAAAERPPWLDSTVTYTVLDAGQPVQHQAVVSEALLGPASPPGERCDDHGRAFVPAVQAGTNAVVAEAAAVAKVIGDAHLKDVDDTYLDLAGSVLLNPIVWIALILAAILGLTSLRFQDKPLPKPVTPPLPPPTKPGSGAPDASA